MKNSREKTRSPQQNQNIGEQLVSIASNFICQTTFCLANIFEFPLIDVFFIEGTTPLIRTSNTTSTHSATTNPTTQSRRPHIMPEN
jgi:hypothetical protein